MLKIIITRILQGFLVIACLFTITFFLVRKLPGDALTSEKEMSAEAKKAYNEKYDFDKPVTTQYVIAIAKLFEGDLRESTKTGQPVSKIIAQSFPTSLILGITGMFVAICIGIPAGIISALKKNSYIDYSTMLIAMVGISVPTFVIGPLIAKFIGGNVSFLKVAGWGGTFDWVLPSITLGLGTAAYLARITRAGMLDILSQDYIRTAQAKGVTQSNIITKHALKGGLIPSIAYIGPAFAMLITGSFIVETIFQAPGMGQHFVNATKNRDPFLLQGIVLLFGTLIVAVNIASDIALMFLNPRLRQADNN